jgi:hypothetical protein
MDVVVLADVGFNLYQTISLQTTGDTSNLYAWIQTIFVILYVIEMTLKVCVLGIRKYVSKISNRFDALVTIASLIATIVVLVPNAVTDNNVVRVLVLFRTLRFLRILGRVPRFKFLLHTYVQLVPILGRALVPMFFFFYFFALLGMAVFGGLLYPLNPALVGSYYAGAGYYYAANFNDMWSSFATLFQLMIVNNW